MAAAGGRRPADLLRAARRRRAAGRSRVIRFDGRAVLVTGAGRGLGRAYAHAFAERGAAVVVHDAGVERGGEGGDPSVADAVVEEIRAAGGNAVAAYENLASEQGCVQLVERAARELGRLDVVVNNAGLVIYEEIDEAQRSWDVMRSVQIDAPFHVSRTASRPLPPPACTRGRPSPGSSSRSRSRRVCSTSRPRSAASRASSCPPP